jgi:VIT1/CCC1 family predicted Fe2+/Mn2+ transporter
MLKEGPIPRFIHGFIEYAAGVLLLIAPFLFSFDSSAAVAVAILAGIAVLFLAAATEGPTSLINYVPLAAHVVLDYVLAGVLIAMPFIAGFSDETAPTAFFIALGVLHLLVTIGTRFKKDETRESRRSRRRSRSGRDAQALPSEPARERRPGEPREPQPAEPSARPPADQPR